MERRDWSLEALGELIYIDSLDSFDKAEALGRWHETYLVEHSIQDLDLELKELRQLEELFFKNIKFLKEHKNNTFQELKKMQKLKKFLNH